MIDIVGIGANVYDTLISLPEFPMEDTKLRAENISISGGGPCATGLAAASKLGAKCAFIGALASDNAGKFLLNDMEKYGLSNEFVNVIDNHASFTSYILLNCKTASRTCIFHKGNMPAVELTDKQKEAIANAKILMVDGNELSAAIEGAKIAKANGTKVLYDAGGLYDNVENLIPYADILIPSEEFALEFTGKKTVKEAAQTLYDAYNPDVVVVTCGKNGGILCDENGLWEYSAFAVDAIDTNGAGDVFHGAFAFSLVSGYNYRKSCIFSSAVSALKCTGIGARPSVPTFEETKKFLKERAIDE